MAWECLEGLSIPENWRKYPWRLGLAIFPFELHAEILEQSIRLGRFPGILTLLWIMQ